MADALVPRGWRYADHVEYSMPNSLDELHGPTGGMVRVPPHIKTAPGATYDLDTISGLWTAYSAIVRDGRPDDHRALLNRETLVRLWPDLNLPKRCRESWTAKFAELRDLPVRAMIV